MREHNENMDATKRHFPLDGSNPGAQMVGVPRSTFALPLCLVAPQCSVKSVSVFCLDNSGLNVHMKQKPMHLNHRAST